MRFRKNGLPVNRLAVSIKRTVAGAVRRSYQKRMIREVFIGSLLEVPGGLDVWVSVRRDFGPESRSESEKELLQLFARAHNQC